MTSGNWIMIFSDGTGQRGVRDDNDYKYTNIFQMYEAIDGTSGFDCFYDAGLGAPEDGSLSWTRTFRNLWSKATGWGITANIVDCYEAVLQTWQPGSRIGLFGFSRGAYTVRCLGGVLATCGVATSHEGRSLSSMADESAAQRRRIAEEAVAAYKIKSRARRGEAGAAFAERYAAQAAIPDVIGVYDTVKALGLPGIMDIVNPWRHEFHDNELSVRIPVGLQALSVDENRKTFRAELWDDLSPEAKEQGQIIEQVWFPGVHSDIGGGYEDGNLADTSLGWMLSRLDALAGLHIPITVSPHETVLGPAHDERTGFGKLYRPGLRQIRYETRDIDALCPDIERRFETYRPDYRPGNLTRHPRVTGFYL